MQPTPHNPNHASAHARIAHALQWAGEDSHSSQWYWNTLAKAARELKQGGSAAAAAPGAAEAAAGASGAAAAAAPAAVQPKRISRSEYLAAIVPGSASPEASSGLGGQSGRAEAAPAPEVQVEVTAEMKARIGPVLKALFSKHTVVGGGWVGQGGQGQQPPPWAQGLGAGDGR